MNVFCKIDKTQVDAMRAMCLKVDVRVEIFTNEENPLMAHAVMEVGSLDMAFIMGRMFEQELDIIEIKEREANRKQT